MTACLLHGFNSWVQSKHIPHPPTHTHTHTHTVYIMIVPTGHTNLKIAAVHLVVQKLIQWKFRRQTQKAVVPVDYLFNRVGRWVIKIGIKQCNQQTCPHNNIYLFCSLYQLQLLPSHSPTWAVQHWEALCAEVYNFCMNSTLKRSL